jgi:hypothetical protein
MLHRNIIGSSKTIVFESSVSQRTTLALGLNNMGDDADMFPVAKALQ